MKKGQVHVDQGGKGEQTHMPGDAIVEIADAVIAAHPDLFVVLTVAEVTAYHAALETADAEKAATAEAVVAQVTEEARGRNRRPAPNV